jgi:predicted AlkP superfamily phosphohydrolase/phosphomutase
MSNKILIVGLDGATFDLFKPWMKQGYLPNLQRLMEEGSHGDLNSTIPALSPVAWTSFATGSNPGKHGIYDFVEREGTQGYTFKFINASSRKMPPLWSVLNKNGKKSVVINVPLSYPPDKIEHCFISGMDSPYNSKFTYPPELYKELKSVLGKYIIEMDRHEGLIENVPKYMSCVKDSIKNRFEASEYLMKKYDWDFFMVVFVLLDRLQHFYWKYLDPKSPDYNEEQVKAFGNPILDVAVILDDYLGKLVKTAGKDVTTIVMSDHGFGPVYKALSINNWLTVKGYMVTKNNGAGIKSGTSITKELLSNMVPKQLKFAIRKKLMKERKHELFQNVDWSKTVAYAEGASPRIFINTASKNLGGTIQEGPEYEAVRDRLINDLMQLRDPDNNAPIIEKVYKKEEIFKGKHVDSAADLFIEFKRGYTNFKRGNVRDLIIITADKNSEFFMNDPELTGEHLPNGILVMKGPHIKKGIKVVDTQIVDLFPTVLYLLNLPIPENIDGKILVQAIKDEFLEKNEGKYLKYIADNDTEAETTEYSDEEETLIQERLRSLGYID